MFATKDWLKASWHAGRDMLRPVTGGPSPHDTHAKQEVPMMVPIRALGPSYRERITQHLLKLEPADRYLRFGYAANDDWTGRTHDRGDSW